jgi:inositol 1,4,5-triphosphate receptor type 1/inositol 1,4,5-triphosphate receptor type 3
MEKAGTTFKKHTEKHWLWNYLFYRYCVNMKDPSDYTGLEYTISTQLEEQKV